MFDFIFTYIIDKNVMQLKNNYRPYLLLPQINLNYRVSGILLRKTNQGGIKSVFYPNFILTV